MANPVQDQLAALPPIQSWQRDATTTDTNLPQEGDPGAWNTPTALDGELRSIKSNVRAFTEDDAWADYTGDELAPSPDGPTKTASDTFTLPGDWYTPGIAVSGRRVRAILTDGSYAYGTILTVTPPATVPGYTVIKLDASVMPSDLSRVQFSQCGSATLTDASQAPNGVLPIPLKMNLVAGKFVLAPESGGTGGVSTALSGDVTGPTTATVVNQLQGRAFNANPTGGLDDVLRFDTTGTPSWEAGTLQAMLSLAQSRTAAANTDKGTIAFPISGTLSGQLKLKWARVNNLTAAINVASANWANLTWNTPFDSICYGVWATVSDSRLIACWPDANVAVGALPIDGAVINYIRSDNLNDPNYPAIAPVGLIIIGLGV